MVEECCLEVLLAPDCRLLALDDDDDVGGVGKGALGEADVVGFVVGGGVVSGVVAGDGLFSL